MCFYSSYKQINCKQAIVLGNYWVSPDQIAYIYDLTLILMKGIIVIMMIKSFTTLVVKGSYTNVVWPPKSLEKATAGLWTEAFGGPSVQSKRALTFQRRSSALFYTSRPIKLVEVEVKCATTIESEEKVHQIFPPQNIVQFHNVFSCC